LPWQFFFHSSLPLLYSWRYHSPISLLSRPGILFQMYATLYRFYLLHTCNTAAGHARSCRMQVSPGPMPLVFNSDSTPPYRTVLPGRDAGPGGVCCTWGLGSTTHKDLFLAHVSGLFSYIPERLSMPPLPPAAGVLTSSVCHTHYAHTTGRRLYYVWTIMLPACACLAYHCGATGTALTLPLPASGRCLACLAPYVPCLTPDIPRLGSSVDMMALTLPRLPPAIDIGGLPLPFVHRTHTPAASPIPALPPLPAAPLSPFIPYATYALPYRTAPRYVTLPLPAGSGTAVGAVQPCGFVL